MLAPNTTLKERYRIIQQLGRGGMGAVYQAMDGNLSCLVAVKETFAETEGLRRAFRREAELLANLSHPALPRVTDHFSEGAGQFLVMQFITGHDLAELLRLRERPFETEKVLEWADQLLDALEELHGYTPPIIHRDIKPANLKLTPKGKIILLDFGLAKGAAGQMRTVDHEKPSQSVMGYTPHYAPPEQMRGTGTDPRCDLYSLAATLWTLLTNRTPPDALARLLDTQDDSPDPLLPANEINAEVPAGVAAVLHQAMALNRNRRPASAAEMRRALSAAAEAARHAAERARLAALEAEMLRLQEETRQREAEEQRRRFVEAEARRREESERVRREAEEGERRRDQQRAQEREQQQAQERERALPMTEAPPTQPAKTYAQVRTLPVEPARSTPGSHRPGKPDDVAPPEAGSKGWVFFAASVLSAALILGVGAWMLSGRSDEPVSASQQQTPTTPAVPAGMAYVPGGEFMMGRNDSDEFERPAHPVTVRPFFMDIYEVTNEQYAEFVRAIRRSAPQAWAGGGYPADAAQRPVTGVTWDDAVAFCRGRGGRLPTEDEWEFAARGTDGRLCRRVGRNGVVWKQLRAAVFGCQHPLENTK